VATGELSKNNDFEEKLPLATGSLQKRKSQAVPRFAGYEAGMTARREDGIERNKIPSPAKPAFPLNHTRKMSPARVPLTALRGGHRNFNKNLLISFGRF